MAQSFFFDAAVTDGTPDLTYSAADLAKEKSAYFTDGVLTPNGMQTSVLSLFLVQISKGSAVIGGYTYTGTSSSMVQVTPADSTYDRIDLVVLRLDINGRIMNTRLLEGTPAADPQPPKVTYNDGIKELALAQIYVRRGVTALTDEDITDVRKFAEFSPWRKTTEAAVAQYLADHGAEIGVLQRVELVRYVYGGTYDFDTALYPSEGNIYDLELVGGGGAGGCVVSEYGRGGGGGAGGYMNVRGVHLTDGIYKVQVGSRGYGNKAGDGVDGGETYFDGFYVPGGKGGKGGSMTDGGEGAVGCGFRGADGGDGIKSVSDITTLPTYGVGASSLFGSGAVTESLDAQCNGADTSDAGCGGGGGCCSSAGSNYYGGYGGAGCVIVYGYRKGNG